MHTYMGFCGKSFLFYKNKRPTLLTRTGAGDTIMINTDRFGGLKTVR